MSAIVEDRAQGAILGALVADTATMGLHWIYDMDKFRGLVDTSGKSATPEFFEPPSCPFYQHPAGSFSPYGTAGHPVLKFMAQHGALDEQAFPEFMYSYYRDVTGYKNHSAKALVAAWEAGKRFPDMGDSADTQADCMVKVAPVVAKFAGMPELEQQVRLATLVQQNNEASLKFAIGSARLLEQVVLGKSFKEAADWAVQPGNLDNDVAAVVKAAQAQTGMDFVEAVWKNGPSCSMPSAFQNAVLAALTSSSYAEGVRKNIMAGGDNCSRAMYLGALLGAEYGASSIPQEWKDKTSAFAELAAMAQKVAAA